MDKERWCPFCPAYKAFHCFSLINRWMWQYLVAPPHHRSHTFCPTSEFQQKLIFLSPISVRLFHLNNWIENIQCLYQKNVCGKSIFLLLFPFCDLPTIKTYLANPRSHSHTQIHNSVKNVRETNNKTFSKTQCRTCKTTCQVNDDAWVHTKYTHNYRCRLISRNT